MFKIGKKILNKFIKFILWIVYQCASPLLPNPNIMSPCETLQKVFDESVSLSRFGDGELRQALLGVSQSIQKRNRELDKRLREVLFSEQEGLLVCLPGLLVNPSEAKRDSRILWEAHRLLFNPILRMKLGAERVFGETQVSRPFFVYQDVDRAASIFSQWRKIFNGRDLVIIEGELTRLGVGSDLFQDVRSMRRILCPARDAFERYQEILDVAMAAPEDSLYLLALGKTASVLAADLSMKNRQALDVGNLDVEYYWYRTRARKKVPVPGKFTYEAEGGAQVAPCHDVAYIESIWKDLTKTGYDRVGITEGSGL